MIELRCCIDVDDMEKAIAFYGTGLGLLPGRRFTDGWAEMLGATSPIDLLANPGGSEPCAAHPSERRDYGRHWTPVHLDFAVTDLDATVARLLELGATLDRAVQERAWGRMANLADPFGNGFCLLEFRGRGYEELAPGGTGTS